MNPIELEHINQHYGVRPVLRDLSVTIRPAELVAVLGPNGMGKSTLLGVMGGVLQPQRGTVTVNGLVRRSSVDNETAIRRHAVFLPDQPWLPRHHTGREFLHAIGRLYDVPEGRYMNHAERLFGLFALNEQADSPITSYSTGQKKKLALASVLISEATILLLDEPFSGGLDPAGIVALKHVLRHRVQSDSATIVLTSPVPEIVEEVADRILILERGEILAFDTLEGLRQQSGIRGSLGKILENLMHPETIQGLRDYFEGETR
jgi:ABC-type multidrug transport system ATPase subunit